jgi:hypothetical protein
VSEPGRQTIRALYSVASSPAHDPGVGPPLRIKGMYETEVPVRIEQRRVISVSESLLTKRNRGKLKLKEEGRCRMCQRPRAKTVFNPHTRNPTVDVELSPAGARVLSGHHMVPKRWFRFQPIAVKNLRDVDANIVPLCRVCHDDVECPEKALRTIARRELRKLLTQEEITFVIQVRGKSWLDTHYPLLRVA